jgi:hypothetical protein
VTTTPTQRRSTAALTVGVIGIILYLVVGWLYLASGLVVPEPWYLLMWGIWIAGLWPMGRVFRRSPMWTPAVPVGAALLWVVIVQLGSWLFDWTA